MPNLIGSGIQQIPTNGMLGNLAFQDKAFVSVDKIGIGSIVVDTGTANQTLQVTGGAYVSGNLGIGTTNPTSKLDIVGDLKSSGIVTASSFVGSLSGTATTANNVSNNININTSGIITATTFYGNLIGSISTTGQSFETIVVTGLSTFTNGPVFIGSGTSTGTINQKLQVTGGAYVSGNLGIGTTNPQTNLQVIGDVRISGITTSTDFDSLSDSNLKTNVQIIENSLEKVIQIRGVTFDWKENNRSSAGVIAQEVEKVLPELVNNENPKTVNYNGITATLIEAIKELKLENDILKE